MSTGGAKDKDFVINSVTDAGQLTEPDFQIEQVYDHAEDDDFSIETTRVVAPIRREMPSLENVKVVGEFDVDNRPVFMSEVAAEKMLSHLNSLRTTGTPYLELAGAPIGRYCVDRSGREFMEVTDYLPFQTASRPGDVVIPKDEHVRANETLDTMITRGDEVNAILGWVHSHPRMTPAPSPTDVETARKHYNLPTLPTIIVNPFGNEIGIFEYTETDGLVNKKGLVVLSKKTNLSSYSYCQKQRL